MSYTSRNKVIILCDSRDSKYLERLRVHLALYERKGQIEVWDETNIEPGMARREELQTALSTARVAILFVSADFIASDFAKNELPILLDASKAEGAVILSVIIGPCLYQETELAEFQAVNHSLKPLIEMNAKEKENLWYQTAKYVGNAMLLSNREKDNSIAMNNSSNHQLGKPKRLFSHLRYRDDAMIENLLSQLALEKGAYSNAMNKFVSLYSALVQEDMLQQLVSLNQGVYDEIQPGQILELRGKARISQWEEMSNTLASLTELNETVKFATGQDMLQNAFKSVEDRQAYKGMSSLVEQRKLQDTIIIIRPLNVEKFQFVANLDSKCLIDKKEDLKTEITIIGMVQRKLAVSETIDVFRLLPDASIFEDMNRENRRKAKRNLNQKSPVDEIIKYPAVNIYPIAIY
jgi:hypothetical protein